jgi:hypothetical protein
VRHRDHRRHERRVVGVGGGSAHEREVDLEAVDGKPAEVGEGREAGPEAVDGEAHPDGPERAQRLHRPVQVLHGVPLGDLEVQEPGLEPAPGERLLHVSRQVLLLQLVGREVHGHPEVARPALVPGAELAAGRLQDPRPHREDDPGEVRECYEVLRHHEPELGPPPAQQGLDAHDPARGELQAGLVVERQLRLLEGGAQAALDGAPLDGAGGHGRGEELVVVAPALLRPVHRGVGVPDERLRVLSVLGVEADPPARRHPHVPALDPEGLAERLLQLVRDLGHVLRVVDPREEQHELVAPEASHGVAFAHGGGEPIRHPLQQLVPRGVAEGVVDALQAVEVEEDDGEAVPVAVGLGERDRQAVEEEAAVGQAGEGVAVGEGGHLLALAVGVGLVPQHEHEALARGGQGQREGEGVAVAPPAGGAAAPGSFAARGGEGLLLESARLAFGEERSPAPAVELEAGGIAVKTREGRVQENEHAPAIHDRRPVREGFEGL